LLECRVFLQPSWLMSSFICVVVLSLLSCIQVRRLFSVDLGGESDCPDVVCLTACITVNQSVDLMRLKLVVICLFFGNLDKTHFVHFVIKNSSSIDLNIMHRNKKIADVYNTKFLGLTLDNTLSWRTHIDTIIPKLSSASFALRVIKPFLSLDLLKIWYIIPTFIL